MFNIGNNKKAKSLLVLIIIVIGFLLRLYASINVPLTFDEKKKIIFLKEIKLDSKGLHLPLGSKITHNPPLLPYLIKFSFLLFRENKFAERLPSVVLGTLTLPLLYFLVRANLNQNTALLALFFVSFSQFHIGATRIAWEDGVLLFFATGVLFFTQQALIFHRKVFLWLAGFFMGLGLLTKGTTITLLPVTVFYIFFYRKNKKKFSIKDLFIFVSIIFIINLPSIYWNIQNRSVDYQFYFKKTELFSFSLVPTALFLGEIIIFGMYGFSDSFIRLICSIEYPFLHWLMGLISMAGAVYFLKNKRNSFIMLLVWIFYFNFIFFSFVRPKTGGGLYFHLDNFWWAAVTVIPGFILGAAMLVELSNRYKLIKFILPVILFYFMINAINFINFPANCFIPRKSIKFNELCDTATSYLKEGKTDKALKIQNYMKRYYSEFINSNI